MLRNSVLSKSINITSLAPVNLTHILGFQIVKLKKRPASNPSTARVASATSAIPPLAEY
jgi:hypothetical protein